MNIVHCFLVGTIICMVSHPIECGPSKSMNGRKVVLMSMDGFRYDYLTKFKGNFSNFEALMASGVKVPYVNNAFVTLTFPSHYTIVTGRYEESHGILDNYMYDPVLDDCFQIGNLKTSWWNGALPIWTSAVNAGLKVGTYFWLGSEVKLDGKYPTEFKKYDGSVPFEDRVDTLVKDWLSKKDFDLGLVYFDEPDSSGHHFGPDDKRMIPVLERMDRLIGHFMKTLEEENLKDKVDFILTSDHGMTNVDEVNQVIVLTEYVNDTLLKDLVGGGAVANLRPQEGKTQELYQALQGIDHITVYLKEDIPERYHYKNNRRVMPIVVIADEGWEVREAKVKRTKKGNHGFDNSLMTMKPIFMATGPSFKKGKEIDPIESVDIYPLLCHLLNIEGAPNNGSFERVKPLLRGANNTANYNSFSMPIFVLMFYVIQLIKGMK